MWLNTFVRLLYFLILSGCVHSAITTSYEECMRGHFQEETITFHIYTREYLLPGQQLYINNITTLDNSGYNKELPTVFIIHGWTHGRDVPWMVEMRSVMAYTGRWNVIVVDWSPLSHSLYVEARLHTNTVGRQLAKFCIFLRMYAYTAMASIHFVGHSLGAQIAAFAGYLLQLELHQSVGRITGLDPAAPMYEYPDEETLDQRLDPGDADFVDVIHTNTNHFGLMKPAGHVDYYPNGGEIQPGCSFWICSHMRACELWTASIINPDLFKACKSESWEEYRSEQAYESTCYPMGIASNPSIPYGSYYLQITLEELIPYIQTTTNLLHSI